MASPIRHSGDQCCQLGIKVQSLPNRSIEVQQCMNTKNDINIFENLNLEEPVRDHASEFAFVFAPLGLQGATGSRANPITVG